MNFKKSSLSQSIGAISLIIATAHSGQLFAQEAGEEAIQEVVVTGFRQSLEAARELKRSMANQTESIVAEDIGKMPDLNLAESLQRVPGVAITREGGEGRQITVRGLGPDFTNTLLNGMEVPASTGGLDATGGVNRSRAFDFNLFSSELFNRITINKSSAAHIDDGGLASTVELFTRRPLDNPGRSISISGQGSYNLDSGELDPRYTAFYSDTFMDDTLGVTLGYTSADRTVNQEGFGTVRYSAAREDNSSWAGTDADVMINGTPNPSANYPNQMIDPTQQLDYIWTPRLPRMDSFNRDQERTGYNIGLQWRPQDALTLGLDVVSSEVKADVSSYNYFAQFRGSGNWAAVQPVEVTLDPSGRLIREATFDNVTPRGESRGQFMKTEFDQVVLSAEYDLTDNMTVKALYGNAQSKHHEEQYRFNIQTKTGHPFMFSFAEDPDIAEMSYGFDIFDPTLYTWTNPTLRLDVVDRDYDTFKLDFEARGDSSIVRTGIVYNDRTVTSERGNPVGDTPTNVVNAQSPVSSSNTLHLSDVVDSYGDIIDAPSGFPTDWLVSNFGASIDVFNAGQFEIDPDDPQSFVIDEEVLGGYVEAEVEATLLGKPLTVNAGIRAVTTKLTSKGFTSDGEGGFLPTSFDKEYTDYLPSTNIVWEFYEDVLFRVSMARNLSRPDLGALTAAAEITPINGSVTSGNPDLDPIRANSYDAGVEWYFADESLASLTFFRKEIESFITSDLRENVTLPPELRAVAAQLPAYDPVSPDPSAVGLDSASWDIRSSINGPGAEVNGYEIGYQQTLDFVLPGVGVFANYTHVQSSREDGGGPLEGLSKNSYNAGVFYENEIIGARIVVNDRDDYVSGTSGNGNFSQGNTGPFRVDMSSFWNINENFTATLEVINLTNEDERIFTTGPTGDLNLNQQLNATGREVVFGIRAEF